LLALLSSLARIPLRQDRAITGSINQLGQIQAIGGVNEKIQGFFAACKASGLTGEQGVIIPHSNQRHLMLNEAVLKAVKHGKFHIWSVKSLDEAIPLLTGILPGEPHPDGSYPAGCFHSAVVNRLNEYNRAVLAATKSTNKITETEEKTNKTEPEASNSNA
jgi:predicted ATP-dependent protease